MTDLEMENMMYDMADFTAETLSKEETYEKKIELKSSLERFVQMLRSKSFARKCKNESKKYGVNEKFIKNIYAQKILNNLADGTGMVIETFGEAFNYLLRFVSYIIQRAVDITVSALVKLVNLVTIRKGVEI